MSEPRRIAVVDIGTNSTRLLICDVDDTLEELERRTEVTRLGAGVDKNGRLDEAAIARVHATLECYAELIDSHECDARVAVLTSAVRDAANGADFVAAVTDRYGLDARRISGEEEAQLTYLGAVAEREEETPTVVADIGGGSTELILGAGHDVRFHVSLQLGVVRHGERHLHNDPPSSDELRALKADARKTIEDGVPREVRRAARALIAVGGTATSLAAIDQDLEPYDGDRVHGHSVSAMTTNLLLARLAALPEAERRRVRGLHPDRAPTIVAGTAILVCVLDAFRLDSFEASEHDILHGVALRAAGAR